MTAAAWPPPWTLKPTEGEPHDSTDEDGESVGWDLSFGFRLNAGQRLDNRDELTLGAHFSDADLARGFVKREVTPAQLREFARLLLNLAAAHEKHLAALETR
jgi:hypothetical protein